MSNITCKNPNCTVATQGLVIEGYVLPFCSNACYMVGVELTKDARRKKARKGHVPADIRRMVFFSTLGLIALLALTSITGPVFTPDVFDAAAQREEALRGF